MNRWTGGVLGLSLASTACVTAADHAQALRRATTADNMVELRACWEEAFEAGGMRGDYVAVVDFTVTAEGRIRAVDVVAVEDAGSGESADAHVLRSCLPSALDGADLSRAGWQPGTEVRVEGYRFGFRDGSKEARAEAEERSSNVLYGPRADRCEGLYTHRPPRAAPVVEQDLAAAKTEVETATSEGDDDRVARALQRSYDVGLELISRLERDLKDDDVPEASRERLRDAVVAARRFVNETGQRIGCR